MLQMHGSVRIGWFPPPLPSGVETFSSWKRRRRGSEEDPQKRSFHAYVFGNVLSYLEHPDPSQKPGAIFASLQANPTTYARLIHGGGGQGKSRLMVEVALLAEAAKWHVFVLSSTEGINAIDVIAQLVKNHYTLLLLDYAEQFGTSLDSLYQRLTALNEDNVGKFRLIMCSRKPGLIDGTAMDEPSLVKIRIDANQGDQLRVIKHILGQDLVDLTMKCKDIPVFAAFIRLLWDRKQADSIAEVRREPDFPSWIRRHVAGPNPDMLALAKLCALLPCSDSTMSKACAIDQRVESYKRSMLTDGWLIFAPGPFDEEWQIAHDLIADGTITQALENKTTANYFAQQILACAAASAAHAQCIHALNRVGDGTAITSDVWSNLFRKSASDWRRFVPDICRSSLVPKNEQLDLMVSMGVTADDLADNLELRKSLGSIVGDAASRRRPLTNCEIEWVERVEKVAPATEFPFLIANWLRSDPESTRAANVAMSWLHANGFVRPAGQVFAGWLNSKRPLDDISDQLDQWLQKWHSTPEAVFPITAWLEHLKSHDRRIDVEDEDDQSIGSVVRRWLVARVRNESPSAGRLYKAWILATKNVSSFKRETMRWLQIHQGQFFTQYVLGALLSNEYPAQQLIPYVKAFTTKPANVVHPDARYLFVNWLRAGGDAALVRNEVLTWLKSAKSIDRNSQTENYDGGRMLLSVWLEKVRDCPAVEPFVLHWLNEDPQRMEREAFSVFLGWLVAKGDQAVIGSQLIEWLARYPEQSYPVKIENLLSAWLKYDGVKCQDIKHFVRRWCEDSQNATYREADYLVANWRNAGGSRNIVRHAIDRRSEILQLFPSDYFSQTPYVMLRSLTNRICDSPNPADLLEEVRGRLLTAHDWLAGEIDHLLRRWLERLGKTGVDLLRTEFTQWIEKLPAFSSACFSLSEILAIREIGEVGEKAAKLAMEELERTGSRVNHLYIFRAWVRSGRPMSNVADFLERWFELPDAVNDGKSEEILRALQESELGQQKWVLQARSRFEAVHKS